MLDLGDKSATKSLTVVGAAIFAGLQAAEGLGAIPAGVAQQVATIASAVAGLLAAFGLRRAIGNPVVIESEPVEEENLLTDDDQMTLPFTGPGEDRS